MTPETLLQFVDGKTRDGRTLPSRGKAVVRWQITAPWIPVAAELPDADETVLVSCANGSDPVWLGYYEDGTWRDVDGSDIEHVTHWLPLPREGA